MKTLLVFYSRTGITRKIAKQIASKLNADIEELIDTKTRTGWLGYFRAARDALQKRKTSIKKTTHNPKQYECIILGTPVWVGTFVPALHTYIDAHKATLANKKLCFLATMGAKEPQKTFLDLEKLTGKKPLATLALQAKRVKHEDLTQPIRQFTKAIYHAKK